MPQSGFRFWHTSYVLWVNVGILNLVHRLTMEDTRQLVTNYSQRDGYDHDHVTLLPGVCHIMFEFVMPVLNFGTVLAVVSDRVVEHGL